MKAVATTSGRVCTLTPEERHKEALKTMKLLLEADLPPESYLPSERVFLNNHFFSRHTSVRELFWLRKIKDKYL